VVQHSDENVESIVKPCPIFQRMIREIMKCDCLQHLDLSYNGLDGHASESLFELISQKSSPLQHLNLSQNTLADQNLQSAWRVMEAMKSNSWLNTLILADCFTNEGDVGCMEQLFLAMRHNRTLESLDVSGCCFNTQVCTYLRRAFYDGVCGLRSLTAMRCNFSPDHFRTLIDIVQNPRQLTHLNVKDNLINTRLLNDLLAAAGVNLAKLEADVPKFVNENDSTQHFTEIFSSTGMSELRLRGWRSWDRIDVPRLSALGIGVVLDIENLGLRGDDMSRLLNAIECASSTLEELNLGGNTFNENTWRSLLHVCNMTTTMKNLSKLGLRNVVIRSEQSMELLGEVLKSPVMLQFVRILDMSDMQWLEEIDSAFWDNLPRDGEPNEKDSFILKLNNVQTQPSFDLFEKLLEILGVTELQLDESSFVTISENFTETIITLTQSTRLTHLSMRTVNPIMTSNETILLMTSMPGLQALRLPTFMQEHILEAIYVLIMEHESLCSVDASQYAAMEKSQQMDFMWNSLRCALASRRLALGDNPFHQ